jgi:ISXO2-like transposase domain
MHFPNIDSILPIISNEDMCIEYLFSIEVFSNIRHCKKCGDDMKKMNCRQIFRCRSSKCKNEESYRFGTFFSRSKLQCCKIMQLAYFWLSRVPVSSAILMGGVSSSTLTDFGVFFRQLVSDSVDEEDVLIGGEGVIVEIDETKLGKRKYHRGHRVEGVWVLGGIEITNERRCFLVKIDDRSEDTLLGVLRLHIRPGSIIRSDMWRGYLNLSSNLDCVHQTVNHSLHFQDPVTGVNKNTIEGTWNGLKILIPARNRVRNGIDDHLWEFIWRRKNSYDLWLGFINALKEVVYE